MALSAERVGSKVRELRLQQRLTQEQLGERIGSDGPRVGRIEKGSENPTLETIDKLATALNVDVSHLFEEPRPDEESGDAVSTGGKPREGHPFFKSMLEATDAEVPAEDSWRGDVLKAIAVLNRALRRGDSGAPATPAKKTGS
jgi:transcriptional regulator with XRE-family HTH domain